jgi:hypothetical protein
VELQTDGALTVTAETPITPTADVVVGFVGVGLGVVVVGELESLSLEQLTKRKLKVKRNRIRLFFNMTIKF